QPVRIGRRALHVVHLPAREVRPADVPLVALAVRLHHERALARADQYPNSAHRSLLWWVRGLLFEAVGTGGLPAAGRANGVRRAGGAAASATPARAVRAVPAGGRRARLPRRARGGACARGGAGRRGRRVT